MAKKKQDTTESDDQVEQGADWTWADPNSLHVNLTFQRLIPLQSRGELLALEESIKIEGCRDPVLVWKGHNIILDGHTRRELCIRHGKQVKVREVDLQDERAAIEYILQLQRQRRNLTREAMSYFRGAEYNAVKQQHGGSRRGKKSSGQIDQLKATAVRLAEKYGVSEKTIRRDAIFALVVDKIVEDYGDEEIRRKLLGADVRMTQGTARALLKMPSDKRKAAVEQLIEQGELLRVRKEKTKKREKTITLPKRPKQLVASLVQQLGPEDIAEVLRALGEAVEQGQASEGEGREKKPGTKRKAKS
jgi:hypothetical protein